MYLHWTHGVAMLVGFGLGAVVFTALYSHLLMKVNRKLCATVLKGEVVVK